MSGLESSLIIGGTQLAIDGVNLYMKKRQEKIDRGEKTIDQKISEGVKNFVKSLSREATPQKERPSEFSDIYEEEKSEPDSRENIINEIIDDIPIISQSVMKTKTKSNPKLIKKLFGVLKPTADLDNKKYDPEFNEFVNKVLIFIRNEMHVQDMSENPILLSHNHYHKKLTQSIDTQRKMDVKK